MNRRIGEDARVTTPLVLLPGLDGAGDFFADFVAQLPPGLAPQVVRYPCDEALGYEALLARVEAELPRGQPWVLLGESFSGPLALQLAARAPPGLAGLVLVASFHRHAVPAFLSAFSGLVGPALFRRAMPGLAVRVVLAGLDAPTRLVSDFQAALATVRPEVLAARAQAALTVDATEAARAVKVPTLYLAAAREALMRHALPDELARLISDFRVEHFDTPHLLLQRQPTEAARVVAAFVEQCVG